MSFLDRLKENDKFPPAIADILRDFYPSYIEAVERSRGDAAPYLPILHQFLDYVEEQLKSPYQFEPYHQSIKDPYYRFGLNFIRPLVFLEKSTVKGEDNLNTILKLIEKGENVILLANHQTETDPQAISLLLEKTAPQIAEEMIFVAGHKVVSDPLAIPFSLGCNLLCIYSKNYIEHPPENKEEKLLHNKKTMKKMTELLAEGGKCIYVAPSGGRDRPNEEGVVDVAPFNPQSIEMFWLMSKQANTPTHFFPLALSTYSLLPPPNTIKVKIGEHRRMQSTPIHLAFGQEIDMKSFPGSDNADKKERRRNRADYIQQLVQKNYREISCNIS